MSNQQIKVLNKKFRVLMLKMGYSIDDLRVCYNFDRERLTSGC